MNFDRSWTAKPAILFRWNRCPIQLCERMRSPLRNQIFLPIAGLLVLAVVLFTAMSAWHAVEVSHVQTLQHMKSVAEALGDASYPLTDDVVRRIGAMSGGDIVVFDREQTISSSTLKPTDELRSQLATLPTNEPNNLSTHTIERNGTTHLVTAIRRTHVRHPGTLYIMMPQTRFSVVWRQSVLLPAVVAIIVLTLALLVAMLISQRVAGRVDLLRNQFRHLASGDFRPVAVVGRDDEIRDLLASANDLSHQLRTMQQELLRSERLQLLGQLSGGLAHQLRNSIAGGRLAIQLHERHCESDDMMLQTALAQLELTEEQVWAVVSLQPDGQPQNEPEQCDICKIAADVVSLLQPHASHWESELKLETPTELTAVLNSPRSVKGALLNLVQNAIEAAGVGGTIEVEAGIEDRQVVIEIRDSGPGFTLTKDELAEAFRTTKSEGMGLGLTIAQHAVDQEGGVLTVDRIASQTVVQVHLPRRAPDADSLMVRSTPQEAATL